MKKLMKLGLAAGMGLCLLAGCVPKSGGGAQSSESVQASSQGTSSTLPKIGVIQLVEHTSLNIIYDSFMEELNALGYVDGKTAEISFQNAQGDMANITSIVQGFDGNKQDVVVAITTPVAQGAMALTSSTPVVFTAVTDPVSAGVVTDMEHPDKGMTGTSDAVQISQILDLALQITPQVQSIGFIYNPGEDNSVSNLALLQDYAAAHELRVEESGISSSAELQTAAASLFEKVDMIFVSNDNTVAEAMPILVTEAKKAGKPVYCGADSMVMDGGLATVGIDYTDLGKESARMVDKVLKGTKVEDIPVKVFKDDLYIYVNTDTAKALDISIPESITSSPKYREIKNQ